jgi:hypothetical protein
VSGFKKPSPLQPMQGNAGFVSRSFHLVPLTPSFQTDVGLLSRSVIYEFKLITETKREMVLGALKASRTGE